MKTNRILSLLIVFVSAFAISSSCQQPKSDGTAQTIDAAAYKKLTQDKSNILLDVRTPQEYAEGHLANSINLDYQSSAFQEEIAKLDKSKSYLVYCRSGKRSAAAMEMMEKAGFKKVTNLDGGIMSWESNGFEVVK